MSVLDCMHTLQDEEAHELCDTVLYARRAWVRQCALLHCASLQVSHTTLRGGGAEPRAECDRARELAPHHNSSAACLRPTVPPLQRPRVSLAPRSAMEAGAPAESASEAQPTNAQSVVSELESTNAQSAADAAFAALVAANPNATVLDGPRGSAAGADGISDADAAFARMAAAFPNATVYGGGESATVRGGLSVDEEYDRLVAAHPGTTVIRGPAGGGDFAVPAAGAASTWRFSSDLSPERLQEIMAMVGAAGLTPPTSDDDGAQRRAADEAFERMLADKPGAREVAPGVFSADELPTGELGERGAAG